MFATRVFLFKKTSVNAPLLWSESLFDDDKNKKTRTEEGPNKRGKHTRETKKETTTTTTKNNTHIHIHTHTRPTRRWNNNQQQLHIQLTRRT
jgi:hypothetical protein